jgi:hypothetical protein
MTRAAAPATEPGSEGSLPVLYIGGVGRSGSTLLERMLGQLEGVWPVGELVHVWERGLRANYRCGCGERFRDCPFWRRVGEQALGGWDSLELAEVLALKRAVDRSRHVPRMCLPGVGSRYRAKARRYRELLERLYRGVWLAAGRPLLVDASKHASHAFLLRACPVSSFAWCIWSGTAAPWPSPGPSGSGGPRWPAGRSSWPPTTRYGSGSATSPTACCSTCCR